MPTMRLAPQSRVVGQEDIVLNCVAFVPGLSWETGSPTSGAGRMNVSCGVFTSVIHV